MATQAVAWRSLTPVQRDGWSSLGLQMTRTDSLGQTYTLSGFQAYGSVNNNRSLAGDAAISVAPTFAIPAPLSGLIPTAVGPSVSLSVAFAPSPLGAAQHIFLWAGGPNSSGVLFTSFMKQILITGAAPVTPLDALADYVARWGGFVAGERITFAAMVYEAGFVSTPFLIATIAT